MSLTVVLDTTPPTPTAGAAGTTPAPWATGVVVTLVIPHEEEYRLHTSVFPGMEPLVDVPGLFLQACSIERMIGQRGHHTGRLE